MPTVIDATVVNQAYDTSGNGGRKLVRLSDGSLITGVKNNVSSFDIFIYKSTDNGQTWTQLCYFNTSSAFKDFAISSVDTNVYIVLSNGISVVRIYKIDALTVTNTNQYANYIFSDTGLNDVGNVSIDINEDETELHAVWASKNSTYSNSFNIRYAKGTINADGSVTWGAVEQVTNVNGSGNGYKNPCIVVYNNMPLIIFENVYNTNTYSIGIAGKTISSDGNYFPVSPWNARKIYLVSGYTQSSPSACVDKNGRIWVAWMGQDSTDNTMNNIRVAYSDDGGATWSTMTKLTSGNTLAQAFPSITVDKNNNVYVVWSGYIASGDIRVRLIKYAGGSWGTITNLTTTASNNHRYPSALFDNTLDFTTPLFIYKDDTKVGFYGTWTVSTISITPGYIGQKTSADRTSLLTYSITTDGTMSTITEKINGVTIATRTNPTSGQEFTVSLTQEQWDAIKYGNAHTLTIEMGSDTWTYTFDKRLNANDDILSAVKGVQDLQTHLNAIKAQLGAAIRAKGGTVNDTDVWSAFVNAVNNMNVKQWASGVVTSSSTTSIFEYAGSTSKVNVSYVTVTGLTFKPSLVFLCSASSHDFSIYSEVNDGYYSKTVKIVNYTGASSSGTNYNLKGDVSPASVTSTGFTLPVWATITNYVWIAIE